MSYENDIRDVAIRMTIKSITDVLRAYKLENPNTSVEVGYNDGLEDAIKATQLFLKVLDRKEGELSE
jgi:hypothetical protein